MAIPGNWVELKPGVAKRLHFMDHAVASRQITDTLFGGTKMASSLVFKVDEEDGVKVEKTFSVLSDKLRKELEAFLPDKRYRGFEFLIVKDAPGQVPPRIVEARPR